LGGNSNERGFSKTANVKPPKELIIPYGGFRFLSLKKKPNLPQDRDGKLRVL
jgi:hypothetical protein